jgi:metal-dependent amidase/aminoacylase/carboxypeptidase family protein
MTAVAQKARADAWIAANRQRWSGWCATVWDYAETAWREYRSALFPPHRRNSDQRSRVARNVVRSSTAAPLFRSGAASGVIARLDRAIQ